MGQSFSTIVIKGKEGNVKTDLNILTKIINENYSEVRRNVKLGAALYEVEMRGAERLIVIYANEKGIKVEDLTETLERQELQRISKELSAEVLRATNSDTVGISQVLIYSDGEHIREKTLGEEWESLEEMQKYIPDATEEDLSYPEVGEETKYEINGSGAISVIEEFEKEIFEPNEYEEISASIYKLKKV